MCYFCFSFQLILFINRKHLGIFLAPWQPSLWDFLKGSMLRYECFSMLLKILMRTWLLKLTLFIQHLTVYNFDAALIYYSPGKWFVSSDGNRKCSLAHWSDHGGDSRPNRKREDLCTECCSYPLSLVWHLTFPK